MKFFHTLFSVCFGTSIFPELKKQTLGRAIWDLCLLATLCTVFIGIAVYFTHCREVESVAGRFFERTGKIGLTPNGIVLEKDPDQSRSYLLRDDFRFDYFAKDSELKDVKPEEWHEDVGIICFRKLAVMWWKVPGDNFNTFRMIYLPVSFLRCILTQGQERMKKEMENLSKDSSRNYTASELKEKIKKSLYESQEEKIRVNPETEKALIHVGLEIDKDNSVTFINTAIVLYTLIAVSTEMTFMLLFTIVLVTIFLFLRNKHEKIHLKTKELAIVTIYTAFPPLVIYSIFQMVPMPVWWLSAEHLFFASFFIYQIFVLRTIYKDGHPEIPEH